MSEKFKVQIAPGRFQQLVEGGYNLVITKSTLSQTGPNVQWSAFAVRAPTITVSWNDSYKVYYSDTDVINGTQVTQTVAHPADLGFNYDYLNGRFTKTESINDHTGLRITNRNSYDCFLGISQFVKNTVTGDTEAPLAVQKIFPNGGSAVFTPTVRVTINFAVTGGNGIVSDITSGSTWFDLNTFQEGEVPTVPHNEDASWGIPAVGLSSLMSLQSLSTRALSGTSIREFELTLSGAVSVDVIATLVLNYLKSEHPDDVALYVRAIRNSGSNSTQASLEVFSIEDVSAAMKKLVEGTNPDGTHREAFEFTHTARRQVSKRYLLIDGFSVIAFSVRQRYNATDQAQPSRAHKK